jgi:hypothetical protein
MFNFSTGGKTGSAEKIKAAQQAVEDARGHYGRRVNDFRRAVDDPPKEKRFGMGRILHEELLDAVEALIAATVRLETLKREVV